MFWVVVSIVVGLMLAGMLSWLWLDWPDIVNDREERAHKLRLSRERRAAELRSASELHAAERSSLADMDRGKK